MSNHLEQEYELTSNVKSDHSWFEKRKIEPTNNIKATSEELLIPFSRVGNIFSGLQRIRSNRVINEFPDESFYSDGSSNVKVLCDKLADFLTLKLLYPKYQYIYTGSTTNLVPVAKILKSTYPDSSFAILADSENLAEAQEASNFVDAKLIYHSIGVNAVLINEGKNAVMAILKRAPSLAWTDGLTMSHEEMNAIASSVPLHENLITSGHVIAIVAPPNGGKTTIMMWVCSQLPTGMKIYYINADVSASDVRHYYDLAKEYNIKLLLPDLKPDKSTDDIYNSLVNLSKSSDDLSNTIFIFDTLKKFTSVISKSDSKTFYKLCRRLTGRGMTIVLLGHTNKYPDKEGNYVYEGTGDLRSDVDELIYLYPVKEDNGSITVSTVIDKSRCSIEPITFNINPNRTVSQVNYRDTRRVLLKKIDHVEITEITAAIQSGLSQQSDIANHCSNNGSIGKRKTITILKRYINDLWCMTKGDCNSNHYSLPDKPLPPVKQVKLDKPLHS